MTTSTWNETSRANSLADASLRFAGRFWFVLATAGQWIFASYVAILYGRSALTGDFAAWNKIMPHGYVPGDSVGNAAVIAHIALAVIIIFGGPLQLMPQVRRRAPSFHRWLGRVYMPAVILTAIAGLYMIWWRGKTIGDLSQKFGISLDAILIIVFAVLALRYAMRRDITTHRRWALRLFMVVNGVWFFRVGMMFWLFLHRRPVGFDPKTFTGPFLTFLSFADYLLPLAFLELYLRMKERGSASGRFAAAFAIGIASVAMGIGIAMATMVMWLPRL